MGALAWSHGPHGPHEANEATCDPMGFRGPHGAHGPDGLQRLSLTIQPAKSYDLSLDFRGGDLVQPGRTGPGRELLARPNQTGPG